MQIVGRNNVSNTYLSKKKKMLVALKSVTLKTVFKEKTKIEKFQLY